MTTIRWGMIGCGDVTEVKSGPAFRRAQGSALVAVMRRDRAKAEDYARRHGVPRFYDDAAALLADPEVDAVYVATPPSSHRQYTIMAAEAGKPVYVEKPMAMSHAECLSMQEACRRRGVPLFVAYYRRCLPRFLEVKRLIQSGAIGLVRMVNVALRIPPDPAWSSGGATPWRVDRRVAGGGLFVDMGCHTLDLLDFYFGAIVDVAGTATNQAGLYDAEDLVTARFRHESGVEGVGHWCFSGGDRLDRTEIIGTGGVISFATFDNVPVELRVGSEVRNIDIPHPAHVHEPLVQTVVDELLGRGKCPSTGETAARTSAVIDTILGTFSAPAAR